MNGTAIAVDVDALRTDLAAANVTVLTSLKGSETSEERESWQHGAFTKALLDSFNDPGADINRNGLISTRGLATYLNKRVSTLTDGSRRRAWRCGSTPPCSRKSRSVGPQGPA